MRLISKIWVFGLFLLTISFAGRAEEYHLENGRILTGTASSFNGDGVVVKLDVGGFSERIPWAHFNQETLKKLQESPKAAEFVEPFIELPPSTKSRKEAIVIKPVTRPELPSAKLGIVEAMSTPMGIVIIVALLAANLYAAFEIAVFRHRPAALVCGVSAILPVVGPIIFLSLPNAEEVSDYSAASGPEVAPEPINPMAGQARAGGSSLSVASQGQNSGGGSLAGQIWKRADTSFNRRFFETTFTGFFRMVPGEAEKDMVMVFKTAKNEVVAKRVTRITGTEMHVMLQAGGEVPVAFGEISEVRVRHKDQRG